MVVVVEPRPLETSLRLAGPSERRRIEEKKEGIEVKVNVLSGHAAAARSARNIRFIEEKYLCVHKMVSGFLITAIKQCTARATVVFDSRVRGLRGLIPFV